MIAAPWLAPSGTVRNGQARRRFRDDGTRERPGAATVALSVMATAKIRRFIAAPIECDRQNVACGAGRYDTYSA